MLVSNSLYRVMFVHLLCLGAIECLLLAMVKMSLPTWPRSTLVAMCSRGFCTIKVLMGKMKCLVFQSCNWETMAVGRIMENALLQLGFHPAPTLLLLSEIVQKVTKLTKLYSTPIDYYIVKIMTNYWMNLNKKITKNFTNFYVVFLGLPWTFLFALLGGCLGNS